MITHFLAPVTLEAVLQRIHAIYETKLEQLKNSQDFYTQLHGAPSETFAEEIEKKEKQYCNLQQRLEKLQEQQSKRKYQKWKHQEIRGAEYHLIQLETGRGTDVNNRTPRQQEIVNEVVSEMFHYFRYIADGLLNPGRYNSRTGKINRPVIIGGNKVSLMEVRKQLCIEDLVQEGALAVTKEFHKYHPSRGSITTFAFYWAASAMLRYAADKCSLVRIPIRILDTAKKTYLQRSRKRFFQNAEKKITENEKTVPASLQAAAMYLALNGEYVNIWDKVESGRSHDSGHKRIFEEIFLPDEETLSPEEEKNIQEMKQAIRQVLNTLTPRQNIVIRKRFGFEGEEVQSLGEIGAEFNLSRERIRQIEAKALRNLRHPSKAKKLKAFVY